MGPNKRPRITPKLCLIYARISNKNCAHSVAYVTSLAIPLLVVAVALLAAQSFQNNATLTKTKQRDPSSFPFPFPFLPFSKHLLTTDLTDQPPQPSKLVPYYYSTLNNCSIQCTVTTVSYYPPLLPLPPSPSSFLFLPLSKHLLT